MIEWERHYRRVESPLTDDMLRPLHPDCRTVQFDRALNDEDYARLGEWMEAHPEVMLRAYGSHDGSIRDLDFLRFFPRLLRFSADAMYNSLESLEGLRFLPATAAQISIGWTKKRLSLRPLEHFVNLQRLYIEGQTKDISVLSQLNSLASLTLRSVSLPDLSILQPLTDLRALDLKLGGTRDLGLLPSIGKLEYLELWMVRGLNDISAIAGLTDLRYLHLESLRQVTRLPDFTQLSRLETVWLQSMKGLRDLSPLLSASRLRQVAAIEMRHLQPEDVAILAQHPTLDGLKAGLGSQRKNNAVKQLLPIANEESWEGWGRPEFLSRL